MITIDKKISIQMPLQLANDGSFMFILVTDPQLLSSCLQPSSRIEVFLILLLGDLVLNQAGRIKLFCTRVELV